MARARSDNQNDEIAAFVQGLYRAGGFATWKEFADAARIAAPQVSDFQRGVTEPAGGNLLALIQAAAAKSGEDAGSLALRLARETFQDKMALTEARLEVIEGLLVALGHGQDKGLDALGVPRDDAESLPGGTRRLTRPEGRRKKVAQR